MTSEPSTNAQVLDEADTIQQKTKESVIRLQNKTNQMEIMGETTIEQLRQQRHQMERVQLDLENTDDQLSKSKKMLNKFGRWAGHWGGRDKRSAKAEAATSIKRDQKRSVLIKKMKSRSSTKKQPDSDLRDGKLKIKSIQKAETISPNECNEEELDKLDYETKERLAKVQDTDNEIDNMLNSVAMSLDRLGDLSLAIKEETSAQTTEVEGMTTKMDTTAKDFYEVNSRMRNFVRST